MMRRLYWSINNDEMIMSEHWWWRDNYSRILMIILAIYMDNRIYWPHSVCVILTRISLTLTPWQWSYIDDIFLLAAFLMRCSFQVPSFSRARSLFCPMILLGLSFGLYPGRTPCAYYSLWIWIPTVDVWSPCNLILPIDDYFRAPQSSR